MTSKEIAEKWFPPGYTKTVNNGRKTVNALLADIDAAIAEAVKATAERCAAIVEIVNAGDRWLEAVEAIRREFKIK